MTNYFGRLSEPTIWHRQRFHCPAQLWLILRKKEQGTWNFGSKFWWLYYPLWTQSYYNCPTHNFKRLSDQSFSKSSAAFYLPKFCYFCLKGKDFVALIIPPHYFTAKSLLVKPTCASHNSQHRVSCLIWTRTPLKCKNYMVSFQ